MKIDKNLVVLVTGGCSGLGRATVELLRAGGANVIAADIDDKQSKVLTKWTGALFHKTDISKEE